MSCSKQYLKGLETKLLLIILSIMMFAGCEKALEIYIGLPLQPTNINSEYKPGLNVFGMLKSGDIYDDQNHFFEVHKIIHISDTSAITVENARIALQQRGRENILHVYHIGDGIYSNSNIYVNPGQTWDYSCVNDTFRVTSTTTLPYMPKISAGSLNKTENSISFSIDNDTSAYMYDIYYIIDTVMEKNVIKRLIPEDQLNTKVCIDITDSPKMGFELLFVIAYDKNYEKYISTSNRFFKPNAYRPRFTTVDGGYGCFGSCTSLMIDFNRGFK
ncbi:MAG: hypothetical protein PF517_09100 [Salinivirgaceae bacterium]|nr:hypothetical protein [Salinivirgaceae bacterium]